MSRTIHVALEGEDIALGCPKNAGACPIAVNLGRTLAVAPTVFRDWVYLYGAGLDGEYDLPPEARAFIDDFDAGLPVEPIEFDMTEVVYDEEKQVQQ